MRSTERRARLRDGSAVSIRAIEPADRPQLRAAFDRLSAESRYRRFMRPMQQLSSAELDYLTAIDHRDHEALVAISAGGDIVGVARYVRVDEPAAAEAAVTVADDWQGRGLGTALLERLVDRAREERIARLRAVVLSENRRALGVLESLGETRRTRAGANIELDIDLPARTGVGPALSAALRAAAAGTIVLARGVAERAGREPRPPRAAHKLTDAIVVGTDGSRTAAVAVDHAGAIARAVGAPLHLVSAGAAGVDELLQWAAADVEGVDVSTHARTGDAASALLEVAEEVGAQLVVVGNRGMTGSRRFLLGSVPNRVSHHATCNVLIVRTS
jgi:nucleotide-binding universal stress UspA family protein/RimJ/RimL family protein N-acetyltransferase